MSLSNVFSGISHNTSDTQTRTFQCNCSNTELMNRWEEKSQSEGTVNHLRTSNLKVRAK